MNTVFKILWVCATVGACAPVPEVASSREVLWNQFGNKPVDALLLAWGTPAGETRLTDGSRMITYQHSTLYEADPGYQRISGCKATFLAKSPGFRIGDVALEGEAYECQLLSEGHTGDNRILSAPTPPIYVPPPYQRFHY